MAAEIISGIYEIVNLVNGKRYVGSAVNTAQRWRQHKSLLGKGNHNPIMQRAWRKYGEGSFEFRLLERVVEKADLLAREQFYLDQCKPEYNVATTAGSNLGLKWSAETIERIGKASRRVWSCPDYRERMANAHKGQKPTSAQLEKISAALRGRKLSAEHAAVVAANNGERNRSCEHRAKMSEFWKGRPKPPEQVAKMVAAKTGKPAHNKGVPMSEEQKAKQSEAMRRKYAEDPDFRDRVREATLAAMARPEVRAKAGAAHRGRKHSPETIAKRSASMKATWARRKAAAE